MNRDQTIHSTSDTRVLILGCFLLFWTPVHAEPALPACRTGDIVFQTSQSDQSEAIQKATHSPYSHCGLVVLREGKPFVLEAVGPVKFTPLGDWIRRGKDGMFKIKRLKHPEAFEASVKDGRFDLACLKYMGKGYDWLFGWGDDKIYCSELVWKVFKDATGQEICPLKRIGDTDMRSPVVKALMKERYGDKIPVDEPTVSPADLFKSPFLTTVR